MKRWLIIGAAVIIAAGAALLIYRQNSRTQGLTKVEGYSDASGQANCLAYSPSCGVCLGEVIDHECWVDESKLTSAERGYMNLD